MGGEKRSQTKKKLTKSGSPPHGRGKENFLTLTTRQSRITPAWAGKSIAASLPLVNCGDHPRMGGEKFVGPDCFRGETGITPAWAGKRCVRHNHSYQQGDHPRMGGEKSS